MTSETIPFSVWSNCTSKKPLCEWNIQQLHDAIKTGAGDGVGTFKDTIYELRKAKSKEEKRAIKASKIPAVTVSGLAQGTYLFGPLTGPKRQVQILD